VSATWRRPSLSRLVFLLAILSLAALPTACGEAQRTTIEKAIAAADGGTVSLNDETVLRIPAGALSDDATVTISTRADGDGVPSVPKGAKPIGRAARIDLGGPELQAPATLEVAIDPGSLPGDTPEELAFLAYFDEKAKQWVPVGGQVDRKRKMMVIETDHLSWWNSFAWDWDAWIAALKETQAASISEIVDAVVEPGEWCDDWESTAIADSSKGNDVIQACVTKGDPVSPEFRITNLKPFGVGISPRPGGPGYPLAAPLAPGETARFAANTSDKPPAIAYADFTEESVRWILATAILRSLPLGDKVSVEGTGSIVDALQGVGPKSIREALFDGPQQAAETLVSVVQTDDFAEACNEAAAEFGRTHEGFEFMATWGKDGIHQVLSETVGVDLVLPITEYVVEHFIDSRPSVTFYWVTPSDNSLP
jgi:hypothetical protein